MASITLPSETAVGMIADGLREKLAAQIESAVRDYLDPQIREACAIAARQLCDAAQVVMHRNATDPFGSIDLHISFNGEKFDLASIVKPSSQTSEI